MPFENVTALSLNPEATTAITQRHFVELLANDKVRQLTTTAGPSYAIAAEDSPTSAADPEKAAIAIGGYALTNGSMLEVTGGEAIDHTAAVKTIIVGQNGRAFDGTNTTARTNLAAGVYEVVGVASTSISADGEIISFRPARGQYADVTVS
jgi:hypothetical protein